MRCLSLAIVLALGACSGKDDDPAPAQKPIADPAVAEALQGPIMVDPGLGQSANIDALRPPPRPDTVLVPLDAAVSRPVGAALTLGAVAQAIPRTAACAGRVRYSAIWSTRLSPAFPLYPDAAVTEAAGTDDGCSLRIVAFASDAAPDVVRTWYGARARAAGYTVRSGGMRVSGERAGALYVVHVQPRDGGGSDVHLIVGG
ncbi:MAG TPA: hypothetical protein VFQ57_04545 [Sphingomonas sp.]|jgi:hypothetical protein|nr:hypothetical protein [Sphingomonas sp.]